MSVAFPLNQTYALPQASIQLKPAPPLQAKQTSALSNLLSLKFIDRWVDRKPAEPSPYLYAPEITAPIETMVNRMAQANGLTERVPVLLVRDEASNAFMRSDGIMAISVGTLRKLQTPEALALVLAHELTHLQKRHTEKIIKRQQMVTTPLLLLVVLGLGFSTLPVTDMLINKKTLKKAFINALKDKLFVAGILSSVVLWPLLEKTNALASLRQETEADSGAVPMLRKAQLSISAIDEFAAYLGEAEDALVEKSLFNKIWVKLFRNHPTTEQRRLNLKTLAQTQTEPPPSLPVFKLGEWEAIKQQIALLPKQGKGIDKII
jgi:predicted Zn-dependent protease